MSIDEFYYFLEFVLGVLTCAALVAALYLMHSERRERKAT